MLLCRAPFPPSAGGACSSARTALALLGGTVVTACGSTPPVKDVDALLGQLDRARSDSQLAGNAAAAAAPKLAAALTVVAEQRAAHAKALTDEITRISGEAPHDVVDHPDVGQHDPVLGDDVGAASRNRPLPPTWSPPSSSPPTARRCWPTQQSGYRAGLLGSIAAACTAAATVALAGAGRPRDLTRRDGVAESVAPVRRPPTPPCSTRSRANTASSTATALVSAHSTPDDNDLVSDSLAGPPRTARGRPRQARRTQRDGRRCPAMGYQLPIEVDSPTDAAKLAVRMEEDSAVAWRAVLEQATTRRGPRAGRHRADACRGDARRKWRQVLGVVPTTVAFPGGTE